MASKLFFYAFGFALTYVWLFLRKNVPGPKFPLCVDKSLCEGVSLQSYADYLMIRVLLVITTVIFYKYEPRWEWATVIGLMVFYVLDFCLSYNTPYAWWSFEQKAFVHKEPSGYYIPFSSYLLIAVVIILLAVKTWILG